jgi:hypothetical protein
MVRQRAGRLNFVLGPAHLEEGRGQQDTDQRQLRQAIQSCLVHCKNYVCIGAGCVQKGLEKNTFKNYFFSSVLLPCAPCPLYLFSSIKPKCAVSSVINVQHSVHTHLLLHPPELPCVPDASPATVPVKVVTDTATPA